MRDAMGGSVTLIIIVVFIVFALGYMAFNVNYTKAFRMKDKIITVFNEYNGKCENNSNCSIRIKEYAKEIGYDSGVGNGRSLNCPEGFKSSSNMYCYKKVPLSGNSNAEDIYKKEKYYYEIVTRINIELPIISRAMSGLRFFNIYGSTKTYIN